MANAKISNDSIFVPKTDIIDVDGLAGFKGSGNVKISGSALVTSLESNMSLSNISGTLSVAKGGTGQTSYTDGQLLIGNTTGNTLTKATLTQGTDLSITNGNGSITLDHAAVSNTPATNSTTLSAGGTFTAINSVTVSSQGHLTAQNTETYTLPSDSDTTYAISAADGDASDEEKIVLTAGGSGSGTSTVVLEASTGLTVARSTDKITFANSAPDQTVVLTAGTGITTSGTYPNFTITNSAPNQATLAAGSSAGELQYTDGNGAFQATSDMVYTTDQLKVQNTLYLDGNGSDAGIVKLGCEAAGASHYVGLEGPTHAGSNSYIIKFPDPDPSVGKILKVSSFSSDKAVMEWADDTDTSIYAADGSLTGARTVTMGSNNLTFASSGGLFTIQKNLKVEGQSYGDITSVSNATVDWDNGNIQSITLPSGASTYTPTNPQAGATYILKIIQPSAGDGTITWGSSVKWPGATAPTLTASNAAVDVVTLIYDGTNYLATSVLNLS